MSSLRTSSLPGASSQSLLASTRHDGWPHRGLQQTSGASSSLIRPHNLFGGGGGYLVRAMEPMFDMNQENDLHWNRKVKPFYFVFYFTFLRKSICSVMSPTFKYLVKKILPFSEFLFFLTCVKAVWCRNAACAPHPARPPPLF